MPVMSIPELNADSDGVVDANNSDNTDVDDVARRRDHSEILLYKYITYVPHEVNIDDPRLEGNINDDARVVPVSQANVRNKASSAVVAHQKRHADYTFNKHNPDYDNPDRMFALQVVDLHHLRVREALRRIVEHLRMCEDAGVERTEVICGRGLHSLDGVAKIKLELINFFHERGIEFSMHKRNPGRLIVFLPTPNAEVEKTSDAMFLT